MITENYKIRVLTDVDYALVYAPVAWATITALLLEKKLMAKRYIEIRLQKMSARRQAFAAALAWTHHRVLRPEKPAAVSMLQVLKAKFAEAQKPVELGVLSGRTPETHPMTRDLIHSLTDAQNSALFNEDLIFLNLGYTSSEFKIKTIIELVRQGLHIIMLEDDFKTGWLLATHPEIPRHMLDVYLLHNLSTLRVLRYRGPYDNDQLPWNLHILPSYNAIQEDILQNFLHQKD